VFNLFLNPLGELRRQDFLIAFAAFTIFLLGINMLTRKIGIETMTSFWIYTAAFPLFIYSLYQVCKKRLRHMGHTARPFWIFLFLMFFLMVASFIYFGAGEHLTEIWEYQEQVKRGELTEEKMVDLIKAREKTYAAKLAENLRSIEIILTIPAILFAAWLALAPGKSNQA